MSYSGYFLTRGFESEASNKSIPMKGLKSNEEKKYPQKPIFLFVPKKPIIRQIKKLISTILCISISIQINLR
jgi:hypothetical protein